MDLVPLSLSVALAVSLTRHTSLVQLWDTRLAVSSAGLNITAPGGVKRLARYGNSQWVQHGVNTW